MIDIKVLVVYSSLSHKGIWLPKKECDLLKQFSALDKEGNK